MADFELDDRLAADTRAVAELPLSTLLLMNDRRWPWLILVPRVAEVSEIADLSQIDRAALVEEIAIVSNALRSLPGAQKLNVGALGNKVRQLHIHVMARHVGDAAWPGPVWGHGISEPYDETEATALVDTLNEAIRTA